MEQQKPQQTPFSLEAAHPTNATLLVDGTLHCKIPKRISIYSLLYIYKSVYMIAIFFQFQALDH